MPGQDFEVTARITLEQALRGTELDLHLSLPEADAQGRLRRVPRTLKVRVPKGATEGQRLRLAGQGGKGFNGGRDGDLWITIALQPHPLFRVDGHDLYIDLPLAPWEAVLGTTVDLPTLAGAVRLKVPPGTQAGKQLRLARRGLPRPDGGEGDLFALVQLVVPPGHRRTRTRAVRAARSGFDASSRAVISPRRRSVATESSPAAWVTESPDLHPVGSPGPVGPRGG